jgi:hypothetical protein
MRRNILVFSRSIGPRVQSDLKQKERVTRMTEQEKFQSSIKQGHIKQQVLSGYI